MATIGNFGAILPNTTYASVGEPQFVPASQGGTGSGPGGIGPTGPTGPGGGGTGTVPPNLVVSTLTCVGGGEAIPVAASFTGNTSANGTQIDIYAPNNISAPAASFGVLIPGTASTYDTFISNNSGPGQGSGVLQLPGITQISTFNTNLVISTINGVVPGGSGGVSQIIAGSNITIDPVGGVGAVTITASSPTSQFQTGQITIPAGFATSTINTFPVISGKNYQAVLTPAIAPGAYIQWVTASSSNGFTANVQSAALIDIPYNFIAYPL